MRLLNHLDFSKFPLTRRERREKSISCHTVCCYGTKQWMNRFCLSWRKRNLQERRSSNGVSHEPTHHNQKKNKPFIHFTGRDKYTGPVQVSQCSHIDMPYEVLTFLCWCSAHLFKSHSAEWIHAEGQKLIWSGCRTIVQAGLNTVHDLYLLCFFMWSRFTVIKKMS